MMLPSPLTGSTAGREGVSARRRHRQTHRSMGVSGSAAHSDWDNLRCQSPLLNPPTGWERLARPSPADPSKPGGRASCAAVRKKLTARPRLPASAGQPSSTGDSRRDASCNSSYELSGRARSARRDNIGRTGVADAIVAQASPVLRGGRTALAQVQPPSTFLPRPAPPGSACSGQDRARRFQ